MKKWLFVLILLLLPAMASAAGDAVFVGDNQILITGTVADDGDFDVFSDSSINLVPGSSQIVIEKIIWYGAAIVIGDICELEIDDTHTISPILNSTVAGQPSASPDLNITVNKLYVDQLDHGSCCIIYRFAK